MKNMTPGLFLMAIFLGLSQNTYGLESHPLTTTSFFSLKEAIQQALRNAPQSLVAKNQFETAQLEEKNAFSIFLPSLDLSATHGVRRTDPTPASETTSAVSATTLTLTQNFYDNGESLKRQQIATLKKTQAEINFQQVRAEIIRKVALAFYRQNISTQNLKYTKKNYDELERLAQLVSNQYHQGLKTRKDFLSFKTRAQRGRLDVIAAEKSAATARAELFIAMGLTPAPGIRFDESITPLLPPKNLDVFDIKPEDLYESKSSLLQKSISEIEIRLAERRFWPELGLVGNATYGSSNYIDTRQSFDANDSAQWSVLLTLKFNLIDWGIRSRNIQIASIHQNSIEQNLKSALLTAQKDLDVFRQDFRTAQEGYRLSKELQQLEEDTFKLLERDYRAGQTTYLELTTGLANLLDAQSRGQEADFALADLYLKFKYYKGTLSEETFTQ